MLLHIPDVRSLSHKKAVNTVMLRILRTAVVNAAARHNEYIRVLADVEIVIDQFLQSALGHYHRNMHAFVLGAGLNVHCQPLAVLAGNDLDVRRGCPSCRLAVGTDIIRAFRNLVQIGNLVQETLLHFVHFLPI